jgi:hypothetical protein
MFKKTYMMVFAALTVAKVFVGNPSGRGSAGYRRLMLYDLDSY